MLWTTWLPMIWATKEVKVGTLDMLPSMTFTHHQCLLRPSPACSPLVWWWDSKIPDGITIVPWLRGKLLVLFHGWEGSSWYYSMVERKAPGIVPWLREKLLVLFHGLERSSWFVPWLREKLLVLFHGLEGSCSLGCNLFHTFIPSDISLAVSEPVLYLQTSAWQLENQFCTFRHQLGS